MTLRAAGKLLEKYNGQLDTRLWIAPPTKMDRDQLTEEGYYGIFGRAGVRIETPDALCVWVTKREWLINQPSCRRQRVTSRTVWELERMCTWLQRSLSAVRAILGRIPTMTEYLITRSRLMPRPPIPIAI
ncbi:hypothetical protein ACT691_12905 [Vibrio metschnikovii]